MTTDTFFREADVSEWAPAASILRQAIDMTRILRISSKPPWLELRDRLHENRVDVGDAVLADWVTEGDVNMGATVATRDGRVFDVMIVMGYDRERHRVADDEGFVTSFREVSPEKVTVTASGRPNSWLQAVKIGQIILGGGYKPD